MVESWNPSFDARCVQLARGVVAGGDGGRSWQALLRALAPHLERWVGNSRLLAQARLANADDSRAALLAVIERLARNEHEAIRCFLDARAPLRVPTPDDASTTAARLARLDEHPDDDTQGETPFRAWLLRVTRFAVHDHVRLRLGHARDGTTRRRVTTDASPLGAVSEPAERPPLTDLLALRERMERVYALVRTFPAPMAHALRLWMDDHDFDTIAREVPVADADAARRLVRAAHARLRAELREAS